MSWNDIRAIAARDCVSGPTSWRLNDLGAVSPWGYVSGPLSPNGIRAIAARDCVSRRPARLCNVALRLSRTYEGQHGCCWNYFLQNAPPCGRVRSRNDIAEPDIAALNFACRTRWCVYAGAVGSLSGAVVKRSRISGASPSHRGWPPSSNSARDIPQRTQTSLLKANRWSPAVRSKVIRCPLTQALPCNRHDRRELLAIARNWRGLPKARQERS
jgi:hypothetical protein